VELRVVIVPENVVAPESVNVLPASGDDGKAPLNGRLVCESLFAVGRMIVTVVAGTFGAVAVSWNVFWPPPLVVIV
jgi:hypothetical protein